MLKTLESLRQKKTKAMDRMETINRLSQNRKMTPAEQSEYSAHKAYAEDLTAAIREAEQEIGTHFSAIQITRDAADTRREAIAAGLLLRADPKAAKEIAEKGREYTNMSMLRIAEECLRFAGT